MEGSRLIMQQIYNEFSGVFTGIRCFGVPSSPPLPGSTKESSMGATVSTQIGTRQNAATADNCTKWCSRFVMLPKGNGKM